MKRSQDIILWMLGAGLGFASAYSGDRQTEPLKQDNYASWEDCMNDWGTEEYCRQAQSQNNQQNYQTRYNGPRYYWDREQGRPVAVLDSGELRPVPSAHPGGNALSHSMGSFNAGSISRGGFGHFSFHGGG